MAAVAVAALFAVPASAATRYADPEGSGPVESCPREDPCSIEDAVQGAPVQDGDTVILRRGAYTVAGGLAVWKAITVRAQRPGKPARIVSEAETALALVPAGAVVRDVNVDHRADGGRGVLLFGGVLERARVSSKGVACQAAAASPEDALIRNSICSGDQAGVAVENATVAGPLFGVLDSVTAHSAGGPGVLVATAAPGQAATVVLGNTIAIGDGPGLLARTDDSAAATAEAIATRSAFREAQAVGSGASVTPAGSRGNIRKRVRLAAIAKGDFRQRAGSPTIDAGAARDPGRYDFKGAKRVQGRRIDIGADESLDPRRLLRLRGRRVRAAKNMKFRGVCPIAACRVSGKAVLRSAGERVPLRIKPTRARAGQRVILRVHVFPGAGPILGALGGTMTVRARVRGPLGFQARVKRRYKIR